MCPHLQPPELQLSVTVVTQLVQRTPASPQRPGEVGLTHTPSLQQPAQLVGVQLGQPPPMQL